MNKDLMHALYLYGATFLLAFTGVAIDGKVYMSLSVIAAGAATMCMASYLQSRR